MLPPLDILLDKNSIEEVSKPGVEYEAAEEIYRQMLKRFEGDHNPTQPNVLRGLYNLGVVLVIYGKLEEGEKVFLRILEEIGGSLRPQDARAVSRALNNLALVKHEQGKSQEAEMHLRRVLDGQEQDLDNWDVDWIAFCNNLAITLCSQNKAREARDLQERVIEKAGDMYGRYGNLYPDISFFRKNLEWIQS
jgi:tetratricopeptide (TPR) repeat protein